MPNSKGDLLFAVLGYATCSSLMLVVNKVCVHVLPAPSFVLLMQVASAAISVKACGLIGLIEVDELELPKLKVWRPPSTASGRRTALSRALVCRGRVSSGCRSPSSPAYSPTSRLCSTAMSRLSSSSEPRLQWSSVPHPAAPLLSEARGIRLQPLQQQRDAAAPLRKGKPAHILPREARRVDDVRALLVR